MPLPPSHFSRREEPTGPPPRTVRRAQQHSSAHTAGDNLRSFRHPIADVALEDQRGPGRTPAKTHGVSAVSAPSMGFESSWWGPRGGDDAMSNADWPTLSAASLRHEITDFPAPSYLSHVSRGATPPRKHSKPPPAWKPRQDTAANVSTTAPTTPAAGSSTERINALFEDLQSSLPSTHVPARREPPRPNGIHDRAEVAPAPTPSLQLHSMPVQRSASLSPPKPGRMSYAAGPVGTSSTPLRRSMLDH